MNTERRPLPELDQFWNDDIRMDVLVSGLTRSCHFRPAGYGNASYLARQMATAIVEMSEEQRWRGRTTETYFYAARSLASFLAAHPKARSLSLASKSSDFANAIDEWEQEMALRAGDKIGPHRTVNTLCRLLLYIDRDFVDLGTITRKRALAGSSLVGRGSRPLPEYSNAERIALRDEARSVIRVVEKRLRLGRDLLRVGQDPRIHGWNNVANLLWMLSRGELTFSIFKDHVDQCLLQWPAGVRDVDNPNRSFHAQRTFRTLLTLLGPTQQDAIAFEILLLQDTVWAPEELHGMLLEDIADTGQGRRYLKRKPRAHKERYQEFKDSSSPWSVNAMMDRWIEATSQIRPLIRPGAPDHLGIVIRPQQNAEGWLVDRRQQTGYTLANWIQDRNLAISKPHEMRRIRKTGKVLRAIQAGTLAGAAGEDHTVEVFTKHYLPSTTISVIAPRVLARATDRVLDHARRPGPQGPSVVQAAAADVASDDEYSQDLRMAGADESSSSDVDKSMLPVTCKDITDSPWAGPGTLCPERVRMCFSCPNSIVFQEHLPRIQSYRDRLEDLRAELAPPQFLENYGQTYANVLAVQAAFPSELVDHARKKAKGEGLNFPMSMRISYGA